jgi:hypothetical protein
MVTGGATVAVAVGEGTGVEDSQVKVETITSKTALSYPKSKIGGGLAAFGLREWRMKFILTHTLSLSVEYAIH